MSKEIELLEALLKHEISNMVVFRPLESFEAELKSLDDDIEKIKEKKEKVKIEYDSRIEHERLFADTKRYIESLKTKEE